MPLPKLPVKSTVTALVYRGEPFNIKVIASEIWIAVFTLLDKKTLWTILQCSQQFRTMALESIDSHLREPKTRSSFSKIPNLCLYVSQGFSQNKRAIYKLSPCEFSPTHVTFKPIPDKDFCGISSSFMKLCDLIMTDPQVVLNGQDDGDIGGCPEGPMKIFRRKEYNELRVAVESGWKSMESAMPSFLRIAYGTLFKHLLKAISSLCNRVEDHMRLNPQMVLLLHVWQLIDALVPRTSKDAMFDSSQFAAGLDIKIEKEFGTGVPDEKPLEFNTFSLTDPMESKISLDWQWSETKGNLRKLKSSFSLTGIDCAVPAEFSAESLQYGQEFEALILCSIQVKLPKTYLLLSSSESQFEETLVDLNLNAMTLT